MFIIITVELLYKIPQQKQSNTTVATKDQVCLYKFSSQINAKKVKFLLGQYNAMTNAIANDNDMI